MTTENSVISAAQESNGKNYGGKKELMSAWSLVAVTPPSYPGDPAAGKMHEVITARVWMSRSADGAGPVYAGVWISAPNFYTAGNGTARGYGYHKPSAAIQGALDSAGIKLQGTIDGSGDSAIEGAFAAIARHFGYTNFLIVRH